MVGPSWLVDDTTKYNTVVRIGVRVQNKIEEVSVIGHFLIFIPR